jgi:hypothetical protein|tara:strand:- start:163 stop:354 length:192 start_codon:yes stop_codon:yes gene_type:complete
MLERIYLRLEILGYSRAIGQMVNVRGVTADNVASLYRYRQVSIDKLAQLKLEAKAESMEASNA